MTKRKSEVTLTLSHEFSEDDAKSLQIALGRHLQVAERVIRIARSSVDPLSLIQVLGPLPAWISLAVPAKWFLKSFFETLGKRAANSTADILRQCFQSKKSAPLSDLAKELVAASEQARGEVQIKVGLDFPDKYFGTAILIVSHEPEKVAQDLANFITRADKIHQVIQDEFEDGEKPLGPVLLELNDDGSITIKWRDGVTCKVSTRHVG